MRSAGLAVAPSAGLGGQLLGFGMNDEGGDRFEIQRRGDQPALAGLGIASAVGHLLEGVVHAVAVARRETAEACAVRALIDVAPVLVAGDEALHRAVLLELDAYPRLLEDGLLGVVAGPQEPDFAG